MVTNFNRKIHSSLPPDELWKNITAAIQDSAGHPFWPTELEEARSTRFRTNGLVHVKYKTLLKSTEVTYRIVTLQNEQRILQYESTGNHPLDGGATVRVTRSPRIGSELQWSGSYSYPWYSPMGAFLPYFLNKFFARLKSNLRDYEKEKRYENKFAEVHQLSDRRARKAGSR